MPPAARRRGIEPSVRRVPHRARGRAGEPLGPRGPRPDSDSRERRGDLNSRAPAALRLVPQAVSTLLPEPPVAPVGVAPLPVRDRAARHSGAAQFRALPIDPEEAARVAAPGRCRWGAIPKAQLGAPAPVRAAAASPEAWRAAGLRLRAGVRSARRPVESTGVVAPAAPAAAAASDCRRARVVPLARRPVRRAVRALRPLLRGLRPFRVRDRPAHASCACRLREAAWARLCRHRPRVRSAVAAPGPTRQERRPLAEVAQARLGPAPGSESVQRASASAGFRPVRVRDRATRA